MGGPLKGAEIALVAGTRVKVGSGDGCDILVADPTLGKAAFELDVGEDEVTIVTSDGTAKTMLDFEAREFGASAFAIGPAEGAWQEIVWTEKREEGVGNGEEGIGNEEHAPIVTSEPNTNGFVTAEVVVPIRRQRSNPDWLFDPTWNMVRVTKRGVDEPTERVSIGTRVAGTAILVR